MIEALLDMLKKESIILFFYIPNVIFTAILFDVLGVKRVYSLIPIYNVYRLYKEYQGRVWKKNWGVLYNIIFIIVTLCVFSKVLTILIISFLGPLTIIVILVTRSTFLVIQYFPVLKNKLFKAVLLLNVLLPFILYLLNYSIENYQLIISVSFMIVCFIGAFDMWYKIRSKKYVLYEKLDYGKLNYDEIRVELKSRGRMLIHPVEDGNQEMEDKKEDIE